MERRDPTPAEIAEMDEMVRENDDRAARLWAAGVEFDHDDFRAAQNEEWDSEEAGFGRHYLVAEYDEPDIDAGERAVDEVLNADERNGIQR